MPVTIAEEDSHLQDDSNALLAQIAKLTEDAKLLRADNQRLAAELDRKQTQPQNELLRARALDAARQEIRELQETCEQQRCEIERLQVGRHQQDDVNSKQKEAITGQMKSLELQVEKQKIIIASHKREMESAQQASIDAKKQAESEIAAAIADIELKTKQSS